MRQRSGGLVILMVSIVAGLLAAILSVSFLRGMAQTTTVLVATQEIQPFTPLTPQMFRSETMPKSAVPKDSVSETAQMNGRFARTLILEGTPLRSGHLAASSGRTGSLAAKLTETGLPGTRALAIPVDHSTGVGGTIEPGDRVDVIAAVRVDRANAPSTQFSKIIARSVPVLHRVDGESADRSTVVVQVSSAQAEEITYALIAGKIYLATTPYQVEREIEQTSGVTPEVFIQRHSGR